MYLLFMHEQIYMHAIIIILYYLITWYMGVSPKKYVVLVDYTPTSIHVVAGGLVPSKRIDSMQSLVD